MWIIWLQIKGVTLHYLSQWWADLKANSGVCSNYLSITTNTGSLDVYFRRVSCFFHKGKSSFVKKHNIS